MSNYGTISAILRYKGSDVWTIADNATVLDAIKLMAHRNVGALLVTREGKPIGMISERDYARKVVLRGKASRELKVSEVLSDAFHTVTPCHTVEECMRIMSKNRVRHLPVLESDQLVGLVSIGDLVNWIISSQTETIHQLESFITGHYPDTPI